MLWWGLFGTGEATTPGVLAGPEVEPRPPWNTCPSPSPRTPGFPWSLFCLWREHNHPRRGPGCSSFLCRPPIWPSFQALFPSSHFPTPQQFLPVHGSRALLPPLWTFLTFSQRHTHNPRNGLLAGVALAITTNLHVLWSLPQLALSSGLSTYWRAGLGPSVSGPLGHRQMSHIWRSQLESWPRSVSLCWVQPLL